jgi:hypothetical protein
MNLQRVRCLLRALASSVHALRGRRRTIVIAAVAAVCIAGAFLMRGQSSRPARSATVPVERQNRANDPPVADAQAVAATQSTPISLTLTGNDYTEGPLTFTITLSPSHGTLGPLMQASSTSATVTYSPAAGYVGPDVFKFRVDNGVLASNIAAVTIGVYRPCSVSTTAWQNLSFASQTGGCTITFDATPNINNMEGVIGVSAVPASNYASLAASVRFNPSGMIDVFNGSSYVAATQVPYAAGQTYTFRLILNLTTHVYDAYVMPVGSQEQVLGTQLAYRPEQAGISTLADCGFISPTGSLQLCAPTVVAGSPLTVSAGSDKYTSGPPVTLTATASGGTPPYTYQWTPATGLSSTTVAQPSASPPATTTYTLRVTDGASGSASDSTTVHVTTSGGGLAPIARWDAVPFQRINAGQMLKVGVVAFSKFGISNVSISISGQGYSGGAIDLTSMSYNDQSKVYEYWAPISATSFTSDGPITVAATVHGGDGGTRALPALSFVVNPTGSLAQPQAWVDASLGNDSTGAVNDSGHPYRRIGIALRELRDWMVDSGRGSKLDGAIVRLKPGTHAADNADIWTETPTNNEWVTITTAAGGTVNDTKLVPQSGCFVTGKLAVRGVTMDRSAGSGTVIDMISSYPNATVWCDGCRMIGSGQYNAGSSILGTGLSKVYLTDCWISDCDYPTLNSNATCMARGLVIEHISNDAFQNVPLVVNCTVDDISPGTTGAHADCIGDWEADGEQSRIVYGLRGTNLHYQGIWNNQDSSYSTPLEGYAFVNVYLQLADPIIYGGGGSAYAFGTNHLLFWNCTFDSHTSAPYSHGFGLYVDGSPRQQTNMTNVSVIGCAFGYVTIQNSPLLSVDMSNWDANHYCQGALQPGTNVSNGNPRLSSDGHPLADSPLLGRLALPITPADVLNVLRPTPAASGAFEP